MLARTLDPAVWAAVPFHFWSICFLAFGCCVGSFLNVCIHRLPRGMSVVSPPSHCPHCRHSIPWFLNVPLFTWLFLRGRCAQCRAPISPRYFIVELLTGLLFLAAWLAVGRQSAWLALAYCLVLAGLTAATFIDFEHYIIPDEITIGGMVAGVLCSFAVPALHGQSAPLAGLIHSFLGLGVGLGIVYLVVRVGKVLFGRQPIELPPGSRVVFTENAIVLPHEEIPFEDVFYRETDAVTLEAASVELIDRCYRNVPVRLLPSRLHIGQDQFDPESIRQMEVVADRLVLPREAMGLGDVKFMGAIGAFLGWQATLFSLMASSILGALVGIALIALRRQDWSSKLPYGPYIAVAAVVWMFSGRALLDWWLGR
ncbi:MAG: hypothetical protein RJA22_2894 [Verrucomicrobiota bacterium]